MVYPNKKQVLRTCF